LTLDTAHGLLVLSPNMPLYQITVFGLWMMRFNWAGFLLWYWCCQSHRLMAGSRESATGLTECSAAPWSCWASRYYSVKRT